MQLCLLDAVQECVPFPQRSLGPQYVLTTGGAALFLESLLHIVLGEIPGRGGMKKGMCAAGFKLHSWCCAFLYASVCLLLMLVQSNRLVIQRISLYYKHVSGVSWSFHCRLFKNVCLFNSHVFGDPGSAGHTRPTADWSHSQRYTHILVNSSSPDYCPIIIIILNTRSSIFCDYTEQILPLSFSSCCSDFLKDTLSIPPPCGLSISCPEKTSHFSSPLRYHRQL